jgi:hypothetical protein
MAATRYAARANGLKPNGAVRQRNRWLPNQQKQRLTILNGDSPRVVTHWSLRRFCQLSLRRKCLNWWAV